MGYVSFREGTPRVEFVASAALSVEGTQTKTISFHNSIFSMECHL